MFLFQLFVFLVFLKYNRLNTIYHSILLPLALVLIMTTGDNEGFGG